MYLANVPEFPAGSFEASNSMNASNPEKDLSMKVKVRRKQLFESCLKRLGTLQLGS